MRCAQISTVLLFGAATKYLFSGLYKDLLLSLFFFCFFVLSFFGIANTVCIDSIPLQDAEVKYIGHPVGHHSSSDKAYMSVLSCALH